MYTELVLNKIPFRRETTLEIFSYLSYEAKVKIETFIVTHLNSKLNRVAAKFRFSPHARQSETALDSEFHAVNSGTSKFRIPIDNWIPESLCWIMDSKA